MVLFIISEHINIDSANIPNPHNILNDLKGSKASLAALIFLSIPLVFSLATELFRRAELTRKGIQRILYIQCFYFSPLYLSIFACLLLILLLPEEEFLITFSAFCLLIGILVLFLIAEVKLIARELQSGVFKAISVFFGIPISAVVGGILFIGLMDSGQIDDNRAGEPERISRLTLPSSGEFSIYIRGYNSVGDYQLTLYNASEIGGAVEQIHYSEGNISPNLSLSYGQSIESKVTQDFDDSSVWKFIGAEGDIIGITVKPLNPELDPIIDVLDATGNSIMSENDSYYTTGIGYFYLLVISFAVIIGFRSLLRKPKIL